ncbi:MAG: DEAD/DEAH box helicase [Salinivirgaceae bacterium]|jgi:SNF2 family DNA or RNA helicase|nr:DEAD/DEAH box helicase [Salinivirgaceae bacterium]
MIQQFVLTYHHNRKTGALLQPAVATKEEQSSFFGLTHVLPDTEKDEIPGFDQQIEEILKLCFEITEKQIFRRFALRKESQPEFYESLTEPKLKTQIRPYIDKRLLKILQKAEKLNVHVFKKQSQNIFESDRLLITSEPVDFRYHFTYKDEQLQYILKLYYKNEELELRGQKVIIISETPSIFIYNKYICFANNFNSKQLIPFVSKPHITVPQRLVNEYFDGFIRKALKKHHVTAEGFTIKEQETNPVAVLTIQDFLDENISMVLTFRYGKHNVISHQSENNAIVSFNEKDKSFTKIERCPAFEQKMINYLINHKLERRTGANYFLPHSNKYTFLEWLNGSYTKLTEQGFTLINNLQENYFIKDITLDVKTKKTNDWFDVEGVIKFGEFTVSFTKLRNHIMKGICEYKLPDDTIAIIPESWFTTYAEIFGAGTIHKDTIRIQPYQFQLLSQLKLPGSDGVLERFENLINSENTYAAPKQIKATLRNYQNAGYQWMRHLREFMFGGCLADDMGLGKTLQTLTLLTYHHLECAQENPAASLNAQPTDGQLDLFAEVMPVKYRPATSLIIVPTSLIHNWIAEVAKFSPELKINNYTGANRIQNHQIFRHYDLVITTYGIIRKDIEALEQFKFDYIIIDESQNIKNPGSATYKAAIKLQSNHKLVLTGTPIENSLTDLWAQLNFINPGIVGNQKWFKEHFAVPIEKRQDEEKLEKLKKLISPFILRRKKADVAKDLPELTEQTIFCEMSAEQKELYDKTKSAVRNKLSKLTPYDASGGNAIMVLKALSQLRQLACSPRLLNADAEEQSGKTEIVLKDLENLVAENHKVLIFSFFTKHLDIIADECKKKKWKYQMLTGKVSQADREQIIAKFQENKDDHIFLISLKAGGVGLNLTAADYVMVLDPWWNPAAEAQAINRAHRIGQKKNVIVYRYVTKDTVEEKIRTLQQNKQQLSDNLIEDTVALKNLTENEIQELFK